MFFKDELGVKRAFNVVITLLALIVFVTIAASIGCTKKQPIETLADVWGTNYSVHKIEYVEDYQVVETEYFANVHIINHLYANFGMDTTSFTNSFIDTVTVMDINNYAAAYGQSHIIDLDTIYKDYWNSHGTICYSPNIGFIDANSTKWDEEEGVASNPFPHKSFTIMIPLSGSGNQIVYHFINNSNPPAY